MSRQQKDNPRCTNPILLLPLSELRPWTENFNEGDVGAIAASIERFGFNGALRVWRDNTVIGGNHSLMALMSLKARGPVYDNAPWPPQHIMLNKQNGEWLVPAMDVAHLDELDAKAFAIADNDIARKAHQDAQKKAQYLIELQQERPESLRAAGWDAEELDEFLAGLADTYLTQGETDEMPDIRQTLAERFIVPPFSVLDARQGYWQKRKAAWVGLGIQSESGRGDRLYETASGAMHDSFEYADTLARKCMYDSKSGSTFATSYSSQNKLNAIQRNKKLSPGGTPDAACRLVKGKTVRGDGVGNPLVDTGLLGISKQARSHYRSAEVFGTSGNIAGEQTGTSIFDPVLCELVYRWFTPAGGAVLDPFAGGSVRGIVASLLGYHYTGIDLSAVQLSANKKQADALCANGNTPVWIEGDSINISEIAPGTYDVIFSCPPYGNLERYSDDPADLSTMDYGAFLNTYRAIVAASVSMLADNRFACFVVGDFRDKKGFYRNFVSETISAFIDAGMSLYNEAILVTACGSLPIRTSRHFASYRKLGKTHQNVLVFYKGDVAAIREFGDVEAGDINDIASADVATT